MKFSWIAGVVLVCAIAGVVILQTLSSKKEPEEVKSSTSGQMTISSPVFENGAPIPSQYTCQGEGSSPPLKFSGIPQKAMSLVLILDDPDATFGTYTHWLLWNIDPQIKEIAENSLPAKAVEGKNSAGKQNYAVPCPPAGTHRYSFKLFALDSKLDLAADSDIKTLNQAMTDRVVDSAEFFGTVTENGK